MQKKEIANSSLYFSCNCMFNKIQDHDPLFDVGIVLSTLKIYKLLLL